MPVAEIAARLDVSERTVRYDLNALRSNGVRTSNIPGRNGGVMIVPQSSSISPRRGTRLPVSIIGYATETELARSLTADADPGFPHVLIITGEAGMGKSHIATSTSEFADGLGYRTLTVTCRKDAPALSPWSEILNQAIGETDSDPEIGRLGNTYTIVNFRAGSECCQRRSFFAAIR